MIEQLERELAEMFHDRAERLDVKPPLPAARIRRARVQSGLAMASVIAVLAGVGLAGARLAADSGGPNPLTVTASGQQAREDLARALRRTFAGEAEATTTTVEVASRKYLDAADLGFSDARPDYGRAVYDTKYDGRVGTAVTTHQGRVTGLVLGDVEYDPVNPAYAGRLFPAEIEWVRRTRDARTSPRDWRDRTIPGAIPGMTALYTMPGDVEERNGRIRVTSPELAQLSTVTVIQLDRSGKIVSLTSRYVLGMANADSDRVDHVVFRPLHGSIPLAAAPEAATVISSEAYDAATKSHDNSANPTCTSTPASTGPDGAAGGVTTCTDVLEPPADATPSDGGATATPVPADPTATSSPR